MKQIKATPDVHIANVLNSILSSDTNLEFVNTDVHGNLAVHVDGRETVILHRDQNNLVEI